LDPDLGQSRVGPPGDSAGNIVGRLAVSNQDEPGRRSVRLQGQRRRNECEILAKRSIQR
jgi:hypothetical protein